MNRQKSIMLLITYNCNLRCSYCYEPKKIKHRMTFEAAQRFITEQVSLAKDSYDSFEIQFMGGEPFLEFSLIKRIARWLWTEPPFNKEYILFAQTNGTLLNDEIKSWLVEHQDKFFIALSLDGTMEMQNVNRSDSFDLVDTSFFIDNWPTQNVKMTISPQTLKNLSKGVKYLHQLGFKYIAADLAMGPTLKWTREDLICYRDELNELVNFYVANPDVYPFSMLRIDPTIILFSNVVTNKTCSCGENLVCVDWNGNTYACHLFSPISVTQKKADLSNVLYDFTNYSQFISDKCKDCRLIAACNHCYGMNYICTNDVSQPDAFHCNAFKVRFFANCKLYMKYSLLNKDIKSYQLITKVINSIK